MEERQRQERQRQQYLAHLSREYEYQEQLRQTALLNETECIAACTERSRELAQRIALVESNDRPRQAAKKKKAKKAKNQGPRQPQPYISAEDYILASQVQESSDKKDKKSEKKADEVKRVFVKPAQIFKQLFCSICEDVFNDPVMGDCQHTFCRKCIVQWIQNMRSATANCPICRNKLPKQANLERNLMASSLIDDLEIFCSNRACDWKGKISESKSHMP